MRKLTNMLNNMYGESELKDNVIDIILDHIEDYEEPKGFLEDIMNYGCASGIVPELIYFSQTHSFFIHYMEDIFNIYNEVKDNLNANFEVNANNLSWLAFEYVVNEIYNEVEAMEEEEEI